jgi:hypothetical protein
VDTGFKMGDGVGAFWKHAYNTEPVATFSFALAVLGKNICCMNIVVSHPDILISPYQELDSLISARKFLLLNDLGSRQQRLDKQARRS